MIIGDQLYFQRKDGVLRQTIGKGETSHLLYEFHDGFCGGHFTKQIATEKILQACYYWPTFFKDAHDYCRSYDVCLVYAERFDYLTKFVEVCALKSSVRKK